MLPQELIQRLEELLGKKERVIVAIDGSCTSGKTTLAHLLEERYDCNLFHMDDFFLRREQRTNQRLEEIGGNVDYERFEQEVLTPLKNGAAFFYRPFDCGTMTLSTPVEVQPKKLNIVEGTYSQHPRFGDSYDLRVFLTVSPELQRQRILERPAYLHERFFREWIPMEQRYFCHMAIGEKSDLVLGSAAGER